MLATEIFIIYRTDTELRGKSLHTDTDWTEDTSLHFHRAENILLKISFLKSLAFSHFSTHPGSQGLDPQFLASSPRYRNLFSTECLPQQTGMMEDRWPYTR